MPAEWRDEVVRSLLEEVIEQHLLAQQALAKRLDVSEADVQEGMQQVRDEYPGPEAFKKAMGDMSPERFRQRTRRTLQASKFLKSTIDPTISVSEADAKAYYDQNLSRFAEGKRNAAVLYGPQEERLPTTWRTSSANRRPTHSSRT